VDTRGHWEGGEQVWSQQAVTCRKRGHPPDFPCGAVTRQAGHSLWGPSHAATLRRTHVVLGGVGLLMAKQGLYSGMLHPRPASHGQGAVPARLPACLLGRCCLAGATTPFHKMLQAGGACAVWLHTQSSHRACARWRGDWLGYCQWSGRARVGWDWGGGRGSNPQHSMQLLSWWQLADHRK